MKLVQRQDILEDKTGFAEQWRDDGCVDAQLKMRNISNIFLTSVILLGEK